MATLYRNVSTSFWSDTKIQDNFTPEDKYFYLYLFTNPHTNLCGCYEISIRQISSEIGYSKDSVENLLIRFEDVHNVISYSKDTKEVLLLNWHKYNWTKSEKFRKALISEIENVKCDDFRCYLVDAFNQKKIPYGYGIEQDNTALSEKDVNEIFERLWKLYPNKRGKGRVSDARKRKVAEIGEAEMQRAIDRYIDDLQKNTWRKVQNGSTFFNSGYVDYLDENYVAPVNREQQMYQNFINGGERYRTTH